MLSKLFKTKKPNKTSSSYIEYNGEQFNSFEEMHATTIKGKVVAFIDDGGTQKQVVIPPVKAKNLVCKQIWRDIFNKQNGSNL